MHFIRNMPYRLRSSIKVCLTFLYMHWLAENDGSEWELEYRSGDSWVPIKRITDIPPRYDVSVTKSTETVAATLIAKNGKPYATLALDRSVRDRVGVIDVKVENASQDATQDAEQGFEPRQFQILFDRLTGLQIH